MQQGDLVEIRTEGFKELQAAFKAMPKEFANKVLATAVNTAAKHVAKGAAAAAPRGGDANRSKSSIYYGRLYRNIKPKGLRKKYDGVRAAVVTRGDSFWGDFLNRGTRYIPATRWFDKIRDGLETEALSMMRATMIKKMNSLADSTIKKYGAGKK